MSTSEFDLNADDALSFLVQSLRENPGGFQQYGYDVWTPSVVDRYCHRWARADPGFVHRSDARPIWLAFHDAEWRLARMGVLRPTQVDPRGTGSPPPLAGYSYTAAGRAWLTGSELTFVSTDPNRYAELLKNESSRLGPGFGQRAREAAACHQTSNYLACCAMCGAAAESALLAIAIAKTRDESEILRAYGRQNGRQNVVKIVFGRKPDNLQQRFIGSAFHLLAYWRDEAAHGRASDISELEAYHSLNLLLRLARYFFAEWDRLTA